MMSDSANGRVELGWNDLLPREWLEGPNKPILWVACFHAMRVSRDALSAGPKIADLGKIRVIVVHGEVDHVPLGEFSIESKEEPEFYFKASGVIRTPKGFYLLIAIPFDSASQTAEKDARDQINTAAGLLAIILGRNITYRLVFENIIDLANNTRTAFSPFLVNPLALPSPNIDSKRLHFTEEAHRAVHALPENERNRIELSLRWLKEAYDSFGTEAFLKFWIAIEAVGMSDKNNIRPIEESLSRAYGISLSETRQRFQVGRIFNFRSKIVHRGYNPPIQASFLDYLEGLYKDVLFERLGLGSERAAEAVHAEPNFNLKELLNAL